MYLYNPNTHRLHIKDYCQHSKGSVPDYKEFKTENEALAYEGRAVSWCMLCLKKREAEMNKKK